MDFNVIPSKRFKKEAKRLIKKFPSLKSELLTLEKTLINKPNSGILLGNNCYKIRISIQSKGQGKRGGGRVVTYLLSANFEVYLLTIFDKSEINSISVEMLRQFISEIFGKQ